MVWGGDLKKKKSSQKKSMHQTTSNEHELDLESSKFKKKEERKYYPIDQEKKSFNISFLTFLFHKSHLRSF